MGCSDRAVFFQCFFKYYVISKLLAIHTHIIHELHTLSSKRHQKNRQKTILNNMDLVNLARILNLVLVDYIVTVNWG